MVIQKAAEGEPIPIHGDGMNVRAWLNAVDHLEALLLAATLGRLSASNCIRGSGVRNSRQMVEAISTLMNQSHAQGAPHSLLIP